LQVNHPQAEAALNMAQAFRECVRDFANISIYSQRLARRFDTALLQLREIQAERIKTEERQLDKAAKILKMLKDENLPYQPAEDGFVFSNSEIETFLQRQDRLERAHVHEFESYA
jgi:predicted negative regulator of RcsB-dependent stress response